MPTVRRAAITGGPGAGKSTLLAELARRGIATVPEVAREILKAPGGMALRERDPLEFAEAMLEAQLAKWTNTPCDRLTIFDRGFCDIVGFLRIETHRCRHESSEPVATGASMGRSFTHRCGRKSTRPMRSVSRPGTKPLKATEL